MIANEISIKYIPLCSFYFNIQYVHERLHTFIPFFLKLFIFQITTNILGA